MRSIIALPDNYTVVDLETTGTNSKQNEIIEIAAIRYRNGEEVARFNKLVAIDSPIPYFVASLTGITDEMLVGKPHIDICIRDFCTFVGDDILIGHNIASFDSCFISEAYKQHIGTELMNPCVDTMRIMKKIYPQWPRFNLSRLATFCGVPYHGAHRAINDCEITHACYQQLRREIRMKCSEEEFIAGCDHRKPPRRLKDFVPANSNIDSSNPLYQKVIVFTGAMSLERSEAIQIAVDAGAIVKPSVSSKTTYLVGGTQDLSRVGTDGLSSKEEKAIALNASGKANIQFVSEKEFLKLARKEGVEA